MHSLLRRQIRKFLPDSCKDNKDLETFLEAVNRSYVDYDDKLDMIQRATALSSEELYEANQRLNKETDSQQKILDALSTAIAAMENKTVSDSNEIKIKTSELVENIEKQTQRIISINQEKDELLTNLERKNEALNNYAHMVSHDLKSPIRNIHSLVGWTYEDGSEDFKATYKENFDLIFQNLTKMDSLIKGILKHATIDALEEDTIPVDLNALVAEIQRTIFIPEHVEISINGELPVLMAGKYRLEQLFKNLLTNAVSAVSEKPEGKIVLSAEKDGDNWFFTVKDNGKGIPRHLQDGIFDMFKKLENDATATGIGLALVKKIINYYNGKIWLDSQKGLGAIFYFTLNLKEV